MKYCTDCKYFSRWHEFLKCNCPQTRRIDGMHVTPLQARLGSAFDLPRDAIMCGIEAKFFEPAPAPTIPEPKKPSRFARWLLLAFGK